MSQSTSDKIGAQHQSSGPRDVSHQSDIARMQNEKDGEFRRKPSSFRNTIEEGGQFAPEKGRYHLYVSYACREWVSP
jgi:glutathionyl-hydroquinone reductase